MTHLRTPRFWLLTTAALVFSSSIPANAQSVPIYQAGAPTMVAAAPGLPSIPAEQIAQDVTSEFNPRTGARELIAAPFDPFEEDPAMAGSLRLRSADGAVAIDGQPLRDGALVELDFYYNSPSDDPFDGRNYGEAAFVNGELAPTVLRDSRILECSTRVENVVYDHTSYYDRGLSVGIYRPYRHYAGHYGFGFGFGNSYYGPGYGHYGSRRSYRNNRSYGYRDRGTRRARNSRSGTHRRVLDAVRNRDGDDARRNRNDTDRSRADRRNNAVQPRRTNSRGLTDRQIEDRTRRIQSYGTGRTRANVRRNSGRSGAMRAGSTQPRIDTGTERSRTAREDSRRADPRQSETRRNESRRNEPRRNENGRNESRRSETRQTQPRRNNAQRSEVTRAEPRRSETRRSEPRRQSNTRSNSRTKNVKKEAPRRRISTGDTKNRINAKKNFFPDDGYGGRGVVSSRSVDCAREDKLRVFIPNDRLDAARFDGLTLIAFDAQGGETPIYLPPNYIEGFRMAATGRVRPQGVQSAPQTITPQYSAPIQRHRIEAAPCPTGTTKQADGTCLQIGTRGYP
ncbi:MAG: hypothetical protein ABJO36_03340 [Litorimonas sp.]